MIKCPVCKKEIAEEANFCPYCMTKFTHDNNEKNVILEKRGNRQKTLIIILLIAVVVMFFVLLMAFYNYNKKSDLKKDVTGTSGNIENNIVSNTIQTENVESTTGATESESVTENVDYTKYYGMWNDKSGNGVDVEVDGGVELQIQVVAGNRITFELTTCQAPPINRVASIENVNSVIEDNKAEFTFSDDGWGNSGMGYLEFRENEIYVKCEITSYNADAMWDLNIDSVLTKDGTKKCYFKGWVDGYASKMIEKLGLDDVKTTNSYDIGGFEIYSNSEESIVLKVGRNDGMIYEIDIYYDRMEDIGDKKKYGYCEGVEYGSSYKQIEANSEQIVSSQTSEENPDITDTTFNGDKSGSVVVVGMRNGNVEYINYLHYS